MSVDRARMPQEKPSLWNPNMPGVILKNIANVKFGDDQITDAQGELTAEAKAAGWQSY